MKRIKRILAGLMAVMVVMVGTGTVKAGGSGSDIAVGCMHPTDKMTYFIDLRFGSYGGYEGEQIKLDLTLNDHVKLNTDRVEIGVKTPAEDTYRWFTPPQGPAIEYKVEEGKVYAVVPGHLLAEDIIAVRVYGTSTDLENLELGQYTITIGDGTKKWPDNTLVAQAMCEKDEGVSTNPPGPGEEPGEGGGSGEDKEPEIPEVPEEKPVEKPGGNSPNTGDPIAPFLWTVLMITGATALLGTITKNKRRK